MNKPAKDEDERPQGSIISTGHGEIDKKVGGGIPVGSLTLIEGQSDAGKSVFAQQMIWGSLRSQHKVLVFTTENSVKSLNTQMESLGLDITDALLLGWLRIYPVETSRMEVTGAFDFILQAIEHYKNYNMVVVDSLTPVIAHTSVGAIIGYFEGCKRLCDDGKTIINIAHTYAFNEEVLARIRSACDAHFKLRIEEVADKLIKVLEVAKVRGADKNTGNVLSFEVEPGMGMRVMPISQAKA
ncbi:MAG: ATPase domain-containing protein [Dehalococcoidia bacterium]|jgi:flagellar protein FlaH